MTGFIIGGGIGLLIIVGTGFDTIGFGITLGVELGTGRPVFVGFS